METLKQDEIRSVVSTTDEPTQSTALLSLARPNETINEDYSRDIEPTDFQEPGLSDILKLQGHGIPLRNSRTKQLALWLKDYYSTSRFMTDHLIPAGMLTAVLHDLITWQLYPENRYGTSILSILGGTANNEQGFASHLGSFERGQVPPTVWPFIYLTVPLMFSLAANLLYRYLPQTETGELEAYLLWEEESGEKKQTRLNTLIRHVERGGLTGFTSLFALSRIAGSFDEADRERFLHNKDAKDILKTLRETALVALQKQGGLTASYLQWKIGKNPSDLSYLFLIPTLLWGLYALYGNGRYAEVFVRKVIDMARYLESEKACRADNKTFLWTEATASYECTACGNWPMVTYRESLTVDGCLKMLLAHPLPPRTLVTWINTLGSNRIVQNINLSAQPWVDWSIQDLKAVFNAIEKLVQPGITRLDLSSRKSGDSAPSLAKIALMTDFINATQPQQLKLEGLSLDGGSLKQWLSGTGSDNTLQQLSLANNPLDDGAIALLAGNLTRFKHLHSLSLGSTQLDDMGVDPLVEALTNNPGITALDLSLNGLSETSLLSLTARWGNLSLQFLDISGLTLSADAAHNFSQALQKRPLRILRAEGSQINDACLMELADGMLELEELRVARNEIDRAGLEYFLNSTKNASLHTLNIAFNAVGDNSMPALGAMLAQNSIHTLILSGNSLSSSGIQTLLNTTLQLAKRPVALQKLVLDYIAVDGKTASVIANCSRNPMLNLTHLSLNDASLTNEAVQILSVITSLQSLSLQKNRFNGSSLDNLMNGARNNNLTRLNIGNNALDSASVQGFAQGLVEPTPQGKKLGKPFISLDERRALMQAVPTTRLQDIGLDNIALDNETQLAVTRVNTATGIRYSNNPNGFYAKPQNPSAAMATLALSPAGLGLLIGLGLVGAILLLCLLYRGTQTVLRYFREEKPERGTTRSCH